MRIIHLLREAILTTLFTAIISGTVCAVEFTWTGAGDGKTWEDPNNWEPNGVPDDVDDVVNFEDIEDLIESDGSRGAILTFEEMFIMNSLGLDFDFESSGTGMRVIQKAGRAGLTADNSTVTFNAALDLQTDAGDDTFRFNFFAQQFGFTSVTFDQPITTNDNDVVIFNPTLNSVLVRLNEDFAGGNTGDVSIDGTASVGVDKTLTADDIHITNGDVTLINGDSQLKVNTVSLDGGSLNVKGGTTPTNPVPDLNSPIESSGGRISQSGENVSIPQGFHISGRRGSVVDLREVAAQTLRFDGPLTRQQGSTLSILANASASVEFASVEGADANGVLPYATYNNADFALFVLSPGPVTQLTSYTPLPSANPGDAAEAVGGMSLASDKGVSVLKVINAVINGGGNTLTTDAILVKGVSASLSNVTVKPHDQPGTDLNELIIHAPVGADRITLTNVDVADNNDPTVLTINGPQGGRVTVNDALTYTGGTNVTSGTVILNGPDAALGTGDVYLGAGALARLINNTFQNNLDVGAGPFGATIEADGNSTVSADITVEVNTVDYTIRVDPFTDRPYVVFNVPQEDDKLTIAGNTGPDESNAGAFNIKIQGGGTVELAEGTTHNVSGTMSVEGATLRLRENAEIIYDRSAFGSFPDGNALQYAALTLSGFGLGRGTLAGNGKLLPLEVPAGTGIALSILFGFAEPGDSIGTLTFGGGVAFLGTEGPATYRAEVTDDGQADKLDIDGLLDLSGTNDFLELDFFSGSTLNGTYTLATYTQLAGVFDTVTFDGTLVADPTAPGAIGGTHRLLYGANALVLTTAASLSGDFDNDGDVDGRDFLVWQRGGSPTPLSAGDLADWQAGYGNGVSAGVGDDPARSTAVPEPSALVLAIIGLFTLSIRAKSRWIR